MRRSAKPASRRRRCSTFSRILAEAAPRPASPRFLVRTRVNACKRVLLIDHRDSFVHTLADYFRQIGRRGDDARAGLSRRAELDALAPDLVVLSPGPGSPSDFALSDTVRALVSQIPALFRRVSRATGHGRVFRRRTGTASRSRSWSCFDCPRPVARSRDRTDGQASRHLSQDCPNAFSRRSLPLALRTARSTAVLSRMREPKQKTASSWRSSTKHYPWPLFSFTPSPS